MKESLSQALLASTLCRAWQANIMHAALNARAAQLMAPEEPQPATPPSAGKTGDARSRPIRNATQPASPDMDAELMPDSDEELLLVGSDEEAGGEQLRPEAQAGLGPNSLALQEGDTLFGLDSQLDRRELPPADTPAAGVRRWSCISLTSGALVAQASCGSGCRCCSLTATPPSM